MEKNNLDSLFREHFHGFEEMPDGKVWENITASLDKKKRKKVVPIWWWSGGAAALLAILLYIAAPFSGEDTPTPSTIVDTEKTAPKTIEEQTKTTNDKLEDAPENNAIVETAKTSNVSKSSAAQEPSAPSTRGLKEPKLKEAQNALASSDQRPTEDIASKNKVITDDNPNPLQNEKAVVIAQNNASETPTTKAPIAKDSTNKEVEETVVAETQEDPKKKSIYEVIEAQEEMDKEALALNAKGGKWSLGPSIAPVYYNSLGEGSPIHSNFASNKKSGQLNLSYGLTVTYEVSPKIKVRSGVHRVDFSYDTNDIVFSSSPVASTNALIDNIDYNQSSRNLVVESKAANPSADFNTSSEFDGDISRLEGSMVQQLGYVEVPLELNFALIDSKFGVNLIGGISSLFLVDNSVNLESDELVTSMGEANNANTLNFSTNVGVGFSYQVSPKIQFDLEPIFKYQLNTFSESAGNFNPYAVGVYSGLSFRF
ncbi:MAG: hypothetical protein AAGF77_04780 [Bacteroidota bacterium]